METILPEVLTNTLTIVFFGNTLNQYLLLILSILLGIVISKLFCIVSRNVLAKLAAKTKVKFDEQLINIIESPATLLIIVLFLNFGIGFLTIEEELMGIIATGIWLLILITITWGITNFADCLLRYYILPVTKKEEQKFYGQLTPVLSKIVKIMIAIIAAIVVLENFGFDITTLVASFGLVGMAVGLAARDTISDIFGGVKIFSNKLFFIGDNIQMPGMPAGTVTSVDLRTTRLRTPEGMLVVPNSKVVANYIKLIPAKPTAEVKVEEEVEMKLNLRGDLSTAKIKKAMSIIKAAINKTRGCKNPNVTFTGFTESGLEVSADYAIIGKYAAKAAKIKEAINLRIKREFERNRIEFAYPTSTVYIERGTTF